MPFARYGREKMSINAVLRVVVSLASVLLSVPLAAQTGYSFLDLGPPVASGDSQFRINNSGQIVGWGCVWQEGHWLNPGLLADGRMSRANDINDSGVVVGWAYTGATDADHLPLYHAVVQETGAPPFDLGTVGVWSWAGRINNSGQIIGRSALDSYGGEQVAVFWDERVLAVVPALRWAGDINNSGLIAGASDTNAILWKHGMVEDLGPGVAVAISDSGAAVGYSQLSSGWRQATLWLHDGVVVALDMETVLDVNNRGAVVGATLVGDSGRPAKRASLWHEGAILDLNSLLPASSGWALLEAQAINDAGQIVGLGTLQGQTHGFLLTPVPEPSGLLALTAASAGLLALARRRRGRSQGPVQARLSSASQAGASVAPA